MNRENIRGSVDFHCDVLSKLLEHEELSFLQDDSGRLDVTLPRLQEARAVLQTFAIYIPEKLERSIVPILDSVDVFYQKVAAAKGMHVVQTASDIQHIQQSGEIGALLSLEGADGLHGNLGLLRTLFKLGVRAVGLTWNRANWAADGVLEPRQGGLTGQGLAMVAECNRLGMILDVSHLSERSFWDMVDHTTKPLIASHSNSKAICDHPRNLNDSQIKALIALNGVIGVTFVPYFVAQGRPAEIEDVVSHIEHICELGGADHIMLGSDFDGIDSYVNKLQHPGDVPYLREALLKKFTASQTEAFFSQNALRFLADNLPN